MGSGPRAGQLLERVLVFAGILPIANGAKGRGTPALLVPARSNA